MNSDWLGAQNSNSLPGIQKSCKEVAYAVREFAIKVLKWPVAILLNSHSLPDERIVGRGKYRPLLGKVH
jgi:hypothetical protein